MTYRTTIPATLLRAGDIVPRFYGDQNHQRVEIIDRPFHNGDTRVHVTYSDGSTRIFYASTVVHIVREGSR